MNQEVNISRSEFLRTAWKSILRGTAEFVDTRVEKQAGKMFVPLLRPPGAIDELRFLATCTRCDLCAEACPHHAISKAGARYGSALDTPILRPAETPCYLCENMPCVQACPEGALLPVETVNIGTAHIALNKCLAHNGQMPGCEYCYDSCPHKDKAILMEAGKPRVATEHCVGCGICEYYCPAPGNAIHVLPNRGAPAAQVGT